ncbi:MAG TPA: methyltransferase domain-containing protein [Casimicrobiaceae bacterium]|nr:methyltransferase domain-containing protein [Casimicrobiaceae bacterium]
MSGPTRDFWEERFVAGRTPWDRGARNPQLERWIASGELEPCRILVPGCGSGHEVAVLAQKGFEVTALDYAPAALALTRERLAGAKARATLIQADALEWRAPALFDAIYEQTCLCAIHPDYWLRYAEQLAGWLSPAGQLFALFMQVLRPGSTEGRIEGPPYHCDINAMRALFPEARWSWPPPPYARVPHSGSWWELAVVLAQGKERGA